MRHPSGRQSQEPELNRLLAVGFELVGCWRMSGEDLAFELTRHALQRNVLYAFVCDGEVKYVGKSTQSLRSRMSGYRRPGPTQSTNVANNARIRALLGDGFTVDILALPDNGLLHYGPFHVNLAAGLEDDVIRLLRPEWNGGTKSTRVDGRSTALSADTASEPVLATFTLTLHRTYYNRGFFNVGVDMSDRFGPHGERIEIYPGTSDKPIWGLINRTANTNHSPRVFGGTELRDWFRKTFRELDQVVVQVLSPSSIRIRTVVGQRGPHAAV